MKHRDSARRKPQARPFRWIVYVLAAIVLCGTAAAGLVLTAFYFQVDRSLPSTHSLKNYHPALVSTVYAADGSMTGEFYIERRYITPLGDMPPHLIKAFLAAEDARFYEHGGVDLAGIVRAFLKNLQAGEIVQGGSTITQQVVKSLLLTPERTWIRKVKEAILAYRIDQSLSKDEILYLYLNQIYLGAGAYGVEAAARTYFGKHVGELDLAESALLAGLPKAPSRFSPFTNNSVARERQRYVLQRMTEVGFISGVDFKNALALPLRFVKPKHGGLKDLDYFTEEVRRQVESKYGRDGLYKEGLTIRTTLDVKAQRLAEKSMDQGLRELDKRHRLYRGLHDNIPEEGRAKYLKLLEERNGELIQGKTVGALVLAYQPQTKSVQLSLGPVQANLPPSGWQWTNMVSSKRASKLFRPGDVLRVRLEKMQEDRTWLTVLEQDPAMEGALLSMDPRTGRVICMVGGRNFEKSQFNRATQAVRQPGSSFKPIIYAAALDRGYGENSILIDSPIIKDDHSLRGPWKPSNYDHQFWGPILLRKALIHSRNVVTVKLLDAIGVDYAIGYARHLGINSPLTPTLALALGASGVTLWELLTAYSTFADQGERVEPYLIEKISDRDGRVLEEHQTRKESVISPQTAYLITHLLEGVISEGTGKAASKIGRPAAGKTGTTNELKDAWFVGYTPSVLTGVWVGYDDHTISLGKGETGGRAACPIWLYFMQEYLKDRQVESFPIPPGIVFAKVNAQTGTPAAADDPSTVYVALSGSGAPVVSGYSDAQRASSPSSVSAVSPSPSESYFKSDLF